ncbi:glycosyltransferase [Halococcus saccharolyticus]|uniref:Dolichol-P-glucose transferase n=1 Tax=Halococcus saccharolyticus DSM 5350 TaxID=1227455 RepID=M0MIG5_9EURY|nr:glycosyltransferase [Halococcus saccharolyticus]EMA45476.1 dolichol-P-glucose transferase [Halococcus saccharolyticus DSM 5350]
MHRSVGVVVPAYRPDVERLATYVAAIDERCTPTTIRIELDAPQSGVAERLADLPATVATSPDRRGKGRAITAGFEALDTDVLVFADADGSTPADSLADVIAPVVADEAALAVGSRRHPDARIARHRTFARRRLGDTFAWLARRLIDPPLYDYQCGAKAISREAWTTIREHLYEPGFAWDIELVAMANAFDLSIEEIPITWHDEPDSTVSPVETSLALANGLLAARHRAALVAESSLHDAIAARREEPTALVDAGRPDR